MKVVTVDDSEAGLERLKKSPNEFDIVLVDVVMPGVDGVETTRQIRKLNQFKDLPVIAYTGKTMPGDKERCIEAGCTEYVTNPAEGDYLLTVVGQSILNTQPISREAEFAFEGIRSLNNIANLVKPNLTKALIGRRILLVDDDSRNLFAVTSYLESQKAEVIPVDNAKEAINRLKTDPHGFDVVLMDIMMPEMDGFQAIREIRSLGRFSELPIIAVTAKAMAEDRQKAVEAGFSDFVPKPVKNNELLTVIQSHIPPDTHDEETDDHV